MRQLKCPMCHEEKIDHTFISYNNVKYSVCSNCKTSYQDPIIEIDYKNTNWEEAIDPENLKKNLKLEQNFKIKNWYGNTINFLNNQKGGSVLDIGCGLGFFLSALNNKWEKYGLETSLDSVEFITNYYQNIKIYEGSIENNNLQSNKTFDVIFFYHVIEHLKKPLDAIRIIKSMLKPNGLLILGTPNNSSFCAKIYKNRFRMLGPNHIFLTTKKQMHKTLLSHGFKIEKVEFPFFKTEYFKFSNIIKLFKKNDISPPFYGNIMTFYAKKTTK